MKNKNMNIATKIFLSFALMLSAFSFVKAEETISPVEQMVLDFFETPDNFNWYDVNGNDVTNQFYNDNIHLYLDDDLDSIMLDFRSYIVSGVREVVEEVPDNSLQSRACIGDCPGDSSVLTYNYNHEIYNLVNSSIWAGSFETIYHGQGYYYVEDGAVIGITTPSVWKDPYTDACAGTNYTVTLDASGTPNLSTKKIEYRARFYVLEETFYRGGYTGYYNNAISIYNSSN